MNLTKKLHFAFSALLVSMAIYGLFQGTPYVAQAYEHARAFLSGAKPNYKFALVLKKGKADEREREILAGVEDQITEVNASDVGFTLSYELHDEGETPEETEKVAFDIGSKPDVLAVIGHDGYMNSKRAADNYLVTQVPFMSLTETNFNLTSFNDWSFRLIFDEIRLAHYVVERMNKLYADRKLVVVTDGDGASPALLSALSEKLPATQVISEKKVRKATQALFDVLSTAPDAVVLLLGKPEFVTSCLGKLMTSKMTIITMDDLNADARLLLTAESNLAEVTLLSPVVTELSSVESKDQAEAYTSKHGFPPSWPYFLARSSVQLVADAIAKNDATFRARPSDIREMRKSVQETWAGSKNISSSVNTSMGQIFFDADGNASGDVQAIDIVAGKSGLSGAQFVTDPDRSMLQSLSIVWASADLIGVELIPDVYDKLKAIFSIDLATRADKSVFDDIVISDTPLSTLKDQLETTSADGWSILRGRMNITIPIERSGIEALTGGKRLRLTIRHGKMDNRKLVLVPSTVVADTRLLSTAEGEVGSREVSNGQGVFLLNGFSSDEGAFNTQEFSQATLLFGLQSPFQSFLQDTFRSYRTGGLFLMLGIGALSLAWGAFSSRASRLGRLDSILLSILLLAGLVIAKLSLYLSWYKIEDLTVAYWMNKIILTGLVFAFGAVGLSITNRLFLLLEGASGMKVAGIVRTFIAIGWWIMILGAIAFVVGEISLGQALATSGLLVFTVGLAIQPLILDAFSGLMLSVERPFMIGDWIELGFPGSSEPVNGRVVDANWRSVSLITRDGNQVTIPNHVITTKHLTNYSRPNPETRIEVNFNVDNGQNLPDVMSGIAAKAAEYCKGTSILSDPPPKIVVEELEDRVIELKLQAWYRADQYSPDSARTDLTQVLGRVMREGGWNFALPTMRYIRVGDTPNRGLAGG